VQVARPKQELLFIGATVFRARNAVPRTLVRISASCDEPGKNEEITFWSSADFALLSGFSSFVGADGVARDLIMAWGNEDMDSVSNIPEFPSGKATFQIVSGQANKEILASIQALHELYDHDYVRLKTAYEGREQARIQHEAEAKANPPKPKDIILNHWRIDPAAITPTSNATTR
jgi:hypothetical protein